MAGDQVFLIPGLATPFLLRGESLGKAERRRTVPRYPVVGETYVHGAMEGEMWNEDLDNAICLY